MLAFDYGYALQLDGRHDKAARMFHRCLVLREDVSGLWASLADSLEALGEKEAAKRARTNAQRLSKSTGTQPIDANSKTGGLSNLN